MFNFDFLAPVLVVAAITLGIYKLFELFVCRRERMMLLERMLASDLKELPRFSYGWSLHFSFSALKWGCLLMGIGLGVLLGYTICWNTIPGFPGDNLYYASDSLVAIIFGASILLLGGLGLVVAFLVELKLGKKGGEADAR